ncbi:MAG: quinone-interacting membrane-bound oxidoreductase complex subunit QmoC [bacterium]
MTQPLTIEPDVGFIRRVAAAGGGSAKKCFQCAACSGICPISPDAKPFPRKEMLWTVWGLKDRLLKDPDVWLCHQCNDCSVNCPRGGSPGEVLNAVRSLAFAHYAFPRFMGAALSRAVYLPLLFAFPAALFLLILGATGHLHIPEGRIVFSHFFPETYVDAVFLAVTALMLAFFAVGVSRFWRSIAETAPPGHRGSILPAVINAAIEILTHSRFKECGSGRPRFTAHLAVFYGFVMLFATTSFVFIGLYVFHVETPLSLANPVKILGNAGAAVLLAGILLTLANRLAAAARVGRGNYHDWLFIVVVLLVTLTGILSEITRLANLPAAAYPMYFAHLVFIFFLIAYLPYSKFAHAVYRTVAIVHSKYTGRYGETAGT